MKAVTYTTVRNSVLRSYGRAIDGTPTPTAQTLADVADAISDTLEYAWFWCEGGWPEIKLVAERTLSSGVITVDRGTGINPIGQILGVYQNHPYTSRNPQPVPFSVTNDGIVISDEFSGQTTLYVCYLKPAPKTDSTEWATATSYTVGEIVHNTTTGDCYECLTAHTSGTFATDLAAAKWEIQTIPAFIFRAVAAGALAMLRDNQNGQPVWSEKAEAVMATMLNNIIARYDFSRTGGQQRLTPFGIR